MQKLNRGQLLDKAFKGEFKQGDLFESNRGDIIIFNGENFVWKDDGRMLRMRMFPNETWVHQVNVTLDLSQKELNTLAVALGSTNVPKLKQNNSDRLHIVESFGEARRLYTKLTEKQVKKAGM